MERPRELPLRPGGAGIDGEEAPGVLLHPGAVAGLGAEPEVLEEALRGQGRGVEARR